MVEDPARCGLRTPQLEIVARMRESFGIKVIVASADGSFHPLFPEAAVDTGQLDDLRQYGPWRGRAERLRDDPGASLNQGPDAHSRKSQALRSMDLPIRIAMSATPSPSTSACT
ncbi:MAG: conjugal transfer protein TraF [Paracoccus sp. (in: a-proteobacteria)]|uniref:conjugal transfer protein TraF n=1 Tax=Paracoccus sp. TaxID=267 RepID=UPI0039E29E37